MALVLNILFILGSFVFLYFLLRSTEFQEVEGAISIIKGLSRRVSHPAVEMTDLNSIEDDPSPTTLRPQRALPSPRPQRPARPSRPAGPFRPASLSGSLQVSTNQTDDSVGLSEVQASKTKKSQPPQRPSSRPPRLSGSFLAYVAAGGLARDQDDDETTL